jgi:adenylate cyclase
MTTRRLAAILAADVAGFSAMMERDEEGTFARVMAVRREVVEPALAKHRGRLVKTTGDGFLAEFVSPVEAVRCALSVQDEMARREAGEAGEALRLRIGVNLGDVLIEDDGDIFGDGVNIAARLEQMAAPGGLCISGKMHDEVEGKVGAAFEDCGEQQVKNIARPVRVYALAGAASAARSLPLPNKPSLAVLPFTNMSGDPEQEYFADGVVEDIITALGRVKSFFVIARNSSFTYKGRAIDVRQVGRELGVRYVLEGSLRKAGNRLRITGQLVEAETGLHIWADRFDGNLEDVFELQDSITGNVVAAIEPRLRLAEIERAKLKRPESLSAYDRYLRALSQFYLSSRDGMAATLRLLEETVELDPDYAPPYALAAQCYVYYIVQGWSDNPERDRAEGVRLARAAVERDRDDPTVLWMVGHALGYLARDYGTSLAFLDRSLRLNPNSAQAYGFSGWARLYSGDTRTAISHLHAALRISPLDSGIGLFQSGLAIALVMEGEHQEAVQWARRAVAEQPNWTSSYRALAASLAHLGDSEGAAKAVAALLEREPTYRIASATAHYAPSAGKTLYVEGLRRAGLPE